MVHIVYSSHFLRSARELPMQQKKKLAFLLELLKDNPFDHKLHTKALSGELSGLYSFRITRDWRVLFQFLLPGEIMLVDIGHRKEIYK